MNHLLVVDYLEEGDLIYCGAIRGQDHKNLLEGT